jgi:hypothetical protein
MSSGVNLAVPYCTDETCAIMAAGDYALLVPRDQRLASGQDGAIAAADPWSFSAASVLDWGARGVWAGMVLRLTGPPGSIAGSADLLVVDGTVTAPYPPGAAWGDPSGPPPGPQENPLRGMAALPLRRKGLLPNAGYGDPPVKADATTLVYDIVTLSQQIYKVSYDLDRQYGTTDLLLGRRHADMFDPLELEQLCAEMVVRDMYLEMARGVQNQDRWLAKYDLMCKAVDMRKDRTVVHWQNAPEGDDRSGMGARRVVRG